MNIRIAKTETELHLIYSPDSGCEWIDENFESSDTIKIKSIFWFSKDDVIDLGNEDITSRTFRIGTLKTDGYYEIKKDVLELRNSFYFHKVVNIRPEMFFAIPDNISVLKSIDYIVSEPVFVGGDRDSAIPESDFDRLLNQFPTRTELKHYSNSRIENILREYLPTMTEAQKALDRYISRKNSLTASFIEKKSELFETYEFELKKYTFIRDRIQEMLSAPDAYDEKDWESKILEFILVIYPKYIKALHSIPVKDMYSNPHRDIMREIDLGLLDDNGNLDIIEIKRPFESCVLSTCKYRDNYVPKKELSGAVVQAEKYIFYLNKWGIEGEKKLNEKYKDELPDDIKINIVNPKAMLILGRSRDFDEQQKFDFEIIRRKYANIMDILTYDDLLARLNHIIAKFEVTYA